MTQQEFSVVRDLWKGSLCASLYSAYYYKLSYLVVRGNEFDIDPAWLNWEFDTFADYICSQILERELEANGIEVED